MIKQPWLAGVSAVLLFVVLGFVVDRLLFLRSAQTSMGTVVNVTSYNGTCGSKNNRHTCTKYNADVEFPDKQNTRHRLNISAGSCRGSNQSLSNASYGIGAKVEVVYDPDKPSRAYPNTFFGVWGTPIMVFAFQISSFLGSLFDKKRS
jgi:hypothetical protein